MDPTVMKKRFYTTILLAFICQLFAYALYGDDWGMANNRVQMSIHTENGQSAEFETNQPVLISVCFKNISTNETFRLYRANAIEFDPGYSWQVISPSGKDISPNMEKIHPSESGGFIPLLPNGTNELKFNMSHLCDFTEIGTYKITGKKGIYSPAMKKAVFVVSKPLFVVVK
ncbi:MAG TPA: hypothetical protein VGN23_10805 [Verrucomicrobiae bacterium]|jgi:hypothetical protein